MMLLLMGFEILMIEGEFYFPNVNVCLDLYGLLFFEDFELNSVRKSGCLLFFQFLHCMWIDQGN